MATIKEQDDLILLYKLDCINNRAEYHLKRVFAFQRIVNEINAKLLTETDKKIIRQLKEEIKSCKLGEKDHMQLWKDGVLDILRRPV